jgi:hypothetical protein
VLGTLPVKLASEEWQELSVDVDWNGTNALYFTYQGTGSLELRELTFSPYMA